MANHPAEWYEDPTGRHELRYWNGSEWTEHVSDGGNQSADPVRSTGGVKLPSAIVAMMERFGRHEIDTLRSSDDGYELFTATQEPLFAMATNDPAGFVKTLADQCIPVGGWAVYGAERTVVNLISTEPPAPDWPRLLDASLEFLRTNFVPPMRIPPYAWRRFVDTGGTPNSWVALRPPPDRSLAPITPLDPDETRIIAKLGPEPDANLVVVRQDGDSYVAEIDARWSDTDPTRSRSDFKVNVDLYDLYRDIGWETQIWDSADPELEPFFPAPKALI
jgi:Protein of unknown function (DUF2510)